WVLTTILFPEDSSRLERLLATALFAVWPAAVASCLNVTPDHAVLAFFVIFLALLLKGKVEIAAVAGLFLVFSKEFGAIVYGAGAVVFLILDQLSLPNPGLRGRWRRFWKNRALVAPVILYVLVSAFALTRTGPAVWGGRSALSRVLKRFVFFNPGEIFLGSYGPSIWLLSFSWILTGIVIAAFFRLLASSQARNTLRSSPTEKAVLFVFLLFASVVYALTRYETFANPRYFLAIAPLLILNSLVGLRVLFARALQRLAVLAVTFVLLLASNF